MNNETVFAQIQLNGSDDISNKWLSYANLNLSSPLSIREPYFKRDKNYMYMYVGVGDHKAVDLRVKNADNADEAATVACGLGTNRIQILTEQNSPIFKAEALNKSVTINGTEIKGLGTPQLTGFNIKLESNNTLDGSGTVSGLSLKQIPWLTLSPRNGRGYGTSLPNTAEPGEIFFLIAEQ